MDEIKAKRTAAFYDEYPNCRIRERMGMMKSGELAQAINERLPGGTKVSAEAVRQWSGGYARPDVSKLAIIAEVLECSTDYLLGLEDARTHDISFICEQTGLSEKAVDNLIHFWNDGNELLAGFNFVCESNESKYFFTALNEYFFGKYLPEGTVTKPTTDRSGRRHEIITLRNHALLESLNNSMASVKLQTLKEYYQHMRNVALLDLQSTLMKISGKGAFADSNDNKD